MGWAIDQGRIAHNPVRIRMGTVAELRVPVLPLELDAEDGQGGGFSSKGTWCRTVLYAAALGRVGSVPIGIML